MFINNINPVLLNLGPFEVRYYGLVYAIGFLCLYFFLKNNIKKGILKISEEQLDLLLIWLIFGSILMARFFEVFIYSYSSYQNHFTDFFKIWNGGLAYHGGIIGTILVVYFFSKKYRDKIKFYEIMDLLVVPAALFLAFGKLANYTNSELYGKITNVSWCVVFERVDSVCRHPVQIYEALSVFIIFGLLLYLYNKFYINIKHQHNKHKIHRSGLLFWTFMLLYGITRFIITFYRDEPLVSGLNVGQWLSLAIIFTSVVFIYLIHKRK